MTAGKLEFKGSIVFDLTPAETPVGRTLVTVRHDGFVITVEGNHMAYTLPSGMKVNVKVAYQDAAGNPAAVDGDVTWASSDDATATVLVDGADSMAAVVSATGPVGQAQITATADADLGAGVRELITIMDVSVVAGEAVAGVISPVGAAQPQ